MLDLGFLAHCVFCSRCFFFFNVQNKLCHPHQTHEEKSLTFLIDCFFLLFLSKIPFLPIFHCVCIVCCVVCVCMCINIYHITTFVQMHIGIFLCTVLILGNFFRPLMKFLRITNLHCINFQKKQRFWRKMCFLTWEKSLNKNLMMSRGDGIK